MAALTLQARNCFVHKSYPVLCSALKLEESFASQAFTTLIFVMTRFKNDYRQRGDYKGLVSRHPKPAVSTKANIRTRSKLAVNTMAQMAIEPRMSNLSFDDIPLARRKEWIESQHENMRREFLVFFPTFGDVSKNNKDSMSTWNVSSARNTETALVCLDVCLSSNTSRKRQRMLKSVLTVSMCLVSDRHQRHEKLNLDLRKTLFHPGMTCFDLGKIYFSHLGKTFVFRGLCLGNSTLGKGSRTLGK